MLKAKLFGIGAAGNKAAITVMEEGVLTSDNVVLLNTTIKDIPANYKAAAIEFGNIRGCGKERSIASKQMVMSLKKKNIPLMIDKDTGIVIIVVSTSGGSGSGGCPMLAKFIKQVYKAKVHIFAFTGFEDDAHELKNTVEFFKDLDKEFVVEAISNKKFLEEANGNRRVAEKLANQEFARRISILLGNGIVDSDTNIDDTDLFKLDTMPGFMTIETTRLNKIRSVEDFNNTIQDMIDNSKSLVTSKSAKAIGVIFNGSERTLSYLDRSFKVIMESYGLAYEIYTHIQNNGDDEYLSLIVAGMKMPKDEIKEMYDKFLRSIEQVDTSEDDFFSKDFNTLTDINTAYGLDFTHVSKEESDKQADDFFSQFGDLDDDIIDVEKEEKEFFSTVEKEI